MSRTAIIYDCEFATAPGAPQRFWCGPNDPDPVVFQIGAVRMSLAAPYKDLERFEVLILPTDRSGAPLTLDPLNARLTGVTDDRLAREGVTLANALDQFSRFAGDDRMWAWGKDEFNMVAISCYVAGIVPPIPADRFGNAPELFLEAGVPLDVIHGLRSNTMLEHFGLSLPDAREHDALGDARMVAEVLRHLMQTDQLDPMRLSAPLHRSDT
ncbi:exonuclease [uncultured Tateyamaria sp.]|uniref:exonuclease n=1 Tax=uncultured Tateyamaria sp. TaxID=455651 RepID=UPI00260419EA|nr:exonuclease [uncultured Tateyamaria sp.]